MKPTLTVTAALLLAAFGSVGCSKSGETSPAKAGSKPALAKPITTPRESLDFTKTGEQRFAPDAAPKITGPVSFADAEAAYHARKYGDATAMFERYTAQRPTNAWGHYMLGLSAWKSGDLAKSAQAFDKALGIDPQHIKSLVNSSRVFIEQKRHDEAIARLTRAAEIDAESVEVHRLLGRTFHTQGRKDEAEDAYRRAIELNELDAWSMNNLGLLFLETQRAEEALPLLAKAVELRHDVPAFQNNLGMALEHTGRFKAAATAYSGALAADPGYGKAKQNLARVEAVKAGPEEPFEVVQTTKESVGGREISGDEQRASK